MPTPHISDILARLDKVTKHGNYWTASCPAHQDTHPSLSVTEKNGKILFKCHKGCDQDQIVENLKAIGAWSDNGDHPEPLAEYTYENENGSVAYIIVRMPDEGTKKKFTVRQADGSWGLQKKEKVLYRLPKIACAECVVIVEGEKDVHTVESLGLVGTTVPFGAGNWEESYVPYLKGKRVALLPDNDETGKEHMEQICRALDDVAKTLKIVNLPGLKERGDISDWVVGKDKKAAREELVQLIKQTQAWSKGEKSLVRVYDVIPKKVEFLWHPYIPIGKVTLMDGDPGVGKSYLTLAIAAGISLGKGLPGWSDEPGNSLLLSTEDGIEDTVRPRLDTMHADTERIFVNDNYFVFNTQGFLKLEKLIEEAKPRVVFIDPLVSYFGSQLDMNKANETREVMAQLARIATKHQCAIVGIRHLRKDTAKTKGNPIYRGTGSIDILGAARSVLMVSDDAKDVGRKCVTHIKCNVAAVGPPFDYRLTHGEFYWIVDGEASTTVNEDIEALEDWEQRMVDKYAGFDHIKDDEIVIEE
jgi:hypothetical protein